MMSFCIQFAQAQSWQSLFNKKDITGWHTLPGGRWEVVDGILIGTSEKSEGGLYETMGRAWVIQPKPEKVKTWYKPNEWNEMTVEARGGIALQLHGEMDMEIMFKEVKIKVL